MQINGIDRVCLRDSGSSIDVCSRSWINEVDLLGEYVWLKSPLDEICHCLPLAKIKIKTKKREFYTKAAIKQDSSDNDLYLLGNRTAELLESDEQGVHLVNAVVTRREDDGFIIPAFEGEGGKSLAKVNGVEFKEEQRKCPDLKPLWDKAQTGIDKEFRVIRGKLVRVAKTKRGEEDRFPREIQSDLGTSFTSELTTTFFNKFGIKVTRSSVSHPQSNAVERVHRTIKRVIKALCVESGEDWEGVLPLALFSLRTVAHESTGFSPTELVMGKNLRTPQTLVYEKWMEEGNTSQSVVEYILQLNNRLKRCQDIAITRMKECQLKRKTWYDRDVVERKFVEGDLAVGSLVVRASDSRPEGLGSMLDVTKYPPSAHGFTCRNCGGGDRGRVAIYRPFGEVSLSLNRTVTCMVLKANDRRTSCPCHDEFRGPRSDYVRQVLDPHVVKTPD
ncbi:retrovirus-related Pol polyprotein from transposon 17.6 [Trichonephila clavipes]|nr:retrovirus-related Pol polyprotein from transposon 17.6 [Trichonephila clavipes]